MFDASRFTLVASRPYRTTPVNAMARAGRKRRGGSSWETFFAGDNH